MTPERQKTTSHHMRPTRYQSQTTLVLDNILTCPVCSVSSLLMRYIRKNLKEKGETVQFGLVQSVHIGQTLLFHPGR